jgi:hypothetical protein
VDKAVSDSVAAQLRSAFPEGTFTQVDVLEYGDDPDVERGDRDPGFRWLGWPPGLTFQDDEKVMRAFEEANSHVITKLHRGGELRSIAWVQLIPDAADRRAPVPVLLGFPSTFLGMRFDVTACTPEFTDVRTRLGPADLATVDALITAGIASSRAEVMRWAIGRIRENPAYTQIEEGAPDQRTQGPALAEYGPVSRRRAMGLADLRHHHRATSDKQPSRLRRHAGRP